MKQLNLTLKIVAVLAFNLPVPTCLHSQTIAYWNFNNLPSQDLNWSSPLSADLGTALLTHNFDNVVSFGGTMINGLEGEQAGGSFCPQGGSGSINNGRWLAISPPLIPSGSYTLSYAGRRTGTGFTSQRIDYSSNGGQDWTTLKTIDISAWENAWKSGQLVEVAVSDLPGMHNNPDFLLRIVVDGASSTSGNCRFDNLRLEAAEGFISTESRLKSWLVGGVEVLGLSGIEVADAQTDPGAVLELEDFSTFAGTALTALSSESQIDFQLNGLYLEPSELELVSFVDGDVLQVTVSAESPQYKTVYKLVLRQASFVEGIQISRELYPFREVEAGKVSDVQFYYLSVGGLTEDIVLQASEGFLISLDCDANYQASLQISDREFNNMPVYVRFVPNELKDYKGSIIHRTGELETEINISGKGISSFVPDNYYLGIDGKGKELMLQLHQLINEHTVLSYGDIWTLFGDADLKFNGKIWDVYGTLECEESPYEYTLYTDQDKGVDVTEEGRFYNREHSWPVSWWGGSDADTMYTDVHHIFPSDKLVNSMRSNFSFGEVELPQWLSLNGSRLGTNVYGSVFDGMVFEPQDSYKGDLARAWFYMLTRYMHRSPSWSNQGMIPDILDGSSWPALKPWILEMLIQWHHEDPVSQKEALRNREIYSLQGNRNPYIDNPEWLDRVFDSASATEGVWLTSLRAHPIPLQEWLYLDINLSSPLMVDVFDSLGRKVYSQEVSDKRVYTGAWPSGIYIMLVRFQGEQQTIKLVK